MRPVTQSTHANEDRGAVLVLVAVMMTALIGMAALVIDIGSLYVERRELQNGSDAAALAVAQDCAVGNCGDDEAAIMAQTYVNNNSSDEVSTLDAVCGVGPFLATCTDAAPPLPTGALGWVRVRTSTATPDGGAEVDYFLAPVIDGGSGGTVRASAVAAWGPVGSALASPLTVSRCEFERLGGSTSTGTFPTGTALFYFHGAGGTVPAGVQPCTSSPSGQDLPGLFGWLDSALNCRITISVDGWVSGDTGNSVPQGCDLTTWRNQELVVAIYDQERGSGSNGEYHIIGFIGLIITGYRFPSNRWPDPPGNQNDFRCPPPVGTTGNGNNLSCIRGEFSRFSTSLGDFGGGADFGGRVIRMIG